jgi:hypothetical protein
MEPVRSRCKICGNLVNPGETYCSKCSPSRPASPNNNDLPDFFRNNAYHILGIDTSIASKDQQKRAREIITRLKIDDIPTYNLDFEPSGNFRNEACVKNAIQNLSSPKQCLKEFFFWFDLEYVNDENITKLFLNQEIQGTINLWRQAIDMSDNKDKQFSYKKNLLISYNLLLASGRFKPYLSPSLTGWEDLITSDDFWIWFFERYRQKTEFELNAETMNEFKTRMPELLSDLYAEIGQITQDPDYFKEFQRKFSIKGERIDKEVLSPIYSEIQSYVDELKSINFDEKDGVNSYKIQKCKTIISKISENLTKLEQLGLYDTSEIKSLRDKVAESIRNVSVAVHNKLNNTDEALTFVTEASKICGTGAYQENLKGEIKQLEGIKRDNDLVKPIALSLERKQFDEALRLISEINQYNITPALSTTLKNLKKSSITGIVFDKYNLAQNYLKNKEPYVAKPLFEEVGTLIYNNLELFNFNKKFIDDIISSLPGRIQHAFSRRNLNELDFFRNELISIAKKHFTGQYEENILVMLIDSKMFPILINSGLYSHHVKSKSCCFVITATMGDRNHPFVILLQQFREDYLLKRQWGRLFNRFYERFGPYCAGTIRNSKFLQSLSLILIVKPGVFIAKKILGLDPKV